MPHQPFVTERDAPGDLVAELAAAGFADADEVGRGGFGVVYRCSQVQLARLVAVKVLTHVLDEDRARFVREQHAMGRLTGHPNIVPVLEVGETSGGHPYLVMPYYPGGCIQDRIRESGLLPLAEVLRLGVKMAGALQSAHDLGIFHRDVKPANIFITDYGEPALGDFGIARVSGSLSTATGMLTGSPGFTAPELLEGSAPTVASDVYSFGATLFAALTGHAALERRYGEQVVAHFLRIAREPVPDLRERGIDEGVAAVVDAAMARDPGDRPSVQELATQLQDLQRSRDLVVDDMAVQASSLSNAARNPARPSASAHRSHAALPVPLESFVGRTAEMEEIRALVSESRLVTMTGVGGIGKTTLAIHAARKLAPEFPDGTWLVELASLRDGALLTDVVATSLGVRDRPGQALRDVLFDFLAERQALLVLDNCEHLIDDVTELADALLRTCTPLRILATSREVLNLSWEMVMPLSPLAVPDTAEGPTMGTVADYSAVELFIERGRAAVPGFSLTEDNAAAIALICSRLDGLPLAIEMAAARLRAMSAAEIADGLSDRYRLLSRGRRSAPARQQTLTDCIEWSYGLCTQEEQRLWRQLSVFAGSFEAQTASDVCGGDMTALESLDLLTSLVDKSILIRTAHRGAARFRLLETVREFGRARLAQDDDVLLCRRHATWYQKLSAEAAGQWFGPEQLRWVKRLTVEMPNIREALQFSLTDSPAIAVDMTAALRPFWVFHTMLNEGGQWTNRALAATPAEPSMQRMRALFSAAHVTHIHGDLATAAGLFAEVRELLDVYDDPVIRGLVNYLEGYTALLTGDLNQARAYFQQALAATDDFEVQAECLQLMGILELISGDAHAALSWSEKGLAVAESQGDWVIRAVTLLSVGVAAWRVGQVQRAEQLLKLGLRLSAESNSTYVIPNQLEILAWIMDSLTRPRPAAVLMAAAAKISLDIGAPLIAGMLGPFHSDCESRTRAELGAAEFETAWDEGTALSSDQAVAFGLAAPATP